MRIINFYKSFATSIPIFITDNEMDIKNRLAVERSSVSDAIYFPKNYDWYKFIDDKDFIMLDLLSVIDKSNITILVQTYIEIKKLYDIEIVDFFRMYVYKYLKDSKDDIHIEALKTIYIFDFFPNLSKEDQKKITVWWNENKSNLLQVYKNIHLEEEKEASDNAKKIELGKEIQDIEPMKILNEKNLGHILQFELETEETAGSCFNKFITNHDLPMAKYKTFHKKFNNNQTRNCSNTLTKCDAKNKCPDSDFECKPITKNGFVNAQYVTEGKYCFNRSEDDLKYFNDLRIYNKDNEVNIHCRTIGKGLWIQCIIILDSNLNNIEKILEILHLDGKIINKKKFGQKTEFMIENSYIDSSIFSDMVMNDKAFSLFFSVNDTDKISKQNKSIYLYFDDFQTRKSLKSSDILVGGWKRSFSRYGDLTAILQSEHDNDDNYYIYVRIIRSVNENVIVSFIEKITKFLKLYQIKFDEYLKLYNQMLTNYVPYKPQISDKKEEDKDLYKLIKAEPKIFISNIYGRSCQNPKPIIIEDPTGIPKEKVLQFPPIEYDGMKPRFYICPTEPYKGEQYLYPGLKQIKKSDHPFGYFPCCYKEKNWFDKNIKRSEIIKNKIKGGVVAASPSKNIEHIIKTNKIIDNLGQLGILPASIENFLLLMDPTREYFRMGIPSDQNFIMLLEYQHSKQNDIPMRSIDEIAAEIITSDIINVGLQENYDIGREGIIKLLNTKKFPPDRFLRIFENFYNVNILIFFRDKSGSINIKLPNHLRSYYRYKHKRSIVAVYQHWGGTMDDLIKIEQAHCELIVARRFNNQFIYRFDQNKTGWETLKTFGIRFFDGTHFDSIISLDADYLFDNLTSQYVDSIGKSRIFFFQHKFPGFLVYPAPPLTIPISNNYNFPLYEDLYDFLSIMGELNSYVYKDYTFIKAKMGSIELIFPAKGKYATRTSRTMKFFFDSIIHFSNEDIRISQLEYKIRISSVIQDYVLYLLSHFVTPTLLSLPSDEWIQLFFNEHFLIVPDGHIYPDFNSIPIVFRSNVKGLIKENKILVASMVRDKLIYFIKWFMGRRGEAEFKKIKNLREIPSYYQYTEDFEKSENQVIYNYNFYYSEKRNYPYSDSILSQLDHTLNEPFYYYNVNQLGDKPYLLVQVGNQERAKSVLDFWHKHRIVKLDEKIDNLIIADVPIGIDTNNNLIWSKNPDSIGRIAPAKGNTYVAILDL